MAPPQTLLHLEYAYLMPKCPDKKTDSISDYVLEHDFDIVFITET